MLVTMQVCFPPLCALTVAGKRIVGAVLIIELLPRFEFPVQQFRGELAVHDAERREEPERLVTLAS